MTQKTDKPREERRGKKCPQCGGKMIGVKAEYYSCTSCEYSEGSFAADLGSIVLGATVGVGIGIGAAYLFSR